MKKLALIMVVAMIAAFAAPAMASDFMAGGQARYEAINVDHEDDSDSSYFDQRYRVAFTWKVNDNVTTQLRADFAEGTWGDGYRPDPGHDTIMVDRAWVRIKQGPLTLTVGQQSGQLGHGLIWSDQFQGAQAKLDFMPVYLNLLYAKEYEGDKDSDDDADIWGGQLGFANDAFDAAVTYVGYNNDDDDSDIAGYGVDVTVPLGDCSLTAALAMFDGDAGMYDYAGTQAFIAVDSAISDAFKVGLTLLWADEVDSDEIQVTAIQDDDIFDHTDFGGTLGANNGLILNTDIFNPGDVGEGALGGILRAQFAAMDTLTFYGKLAYVETQGNDSSFNDVLIANGSVDWVWIPSVTVSAGAFFVSEDWDSGDEDTLLTTLQLTVAF